MSPILPPLVSADDLAAAADRPDVLIVDASTRLATTAEGEPYQVTPDIEGFRTAHVPGAVFADIPGAFSDPAGRFSLTVPTAEQFAAAAGALGIGAGTHVVAYDTAGNAWATRFWWLLRAFGHDAVSVLDGGLAAWTAAGHPTESGEPAPASATFTPRPRPELIATTDEVRRLSTGDGPGVVVNALDPATYRGEQEISPYSRRGRIPGSTNLPLFELLDPATGRFLDKDGLAAKLHQAGILDAERTVTYCGGGIAATLPAFAAYVVSGAEVAVYDGSLSEWTADATLPVETG
ncbi:MULTISPECIES: sulfurtransferase [Pseudonocardia]|uniref:3-mercaptopyruvate sulfurtransferase n=2 Tax=Pseudonocardia TaxID=1847 RepID=A0A1Y2MYT6_PSEAH|nr:MULTISPECIES: rhodanese-like domain-containing protein [Pseudonocardia]OSY40340.1 3-mercaptopyruvate sulfurtransferase [Pseudonocardia autotrophica]TDN72331.1 thiosulfate/3-mercaptopyruvate sulfurtransferase [Pseudonocardia autotrophica]BBG03042.1 sulfurtransferase [Pseudonocardia autotrophica]GEC23664.1 sulfurtransferase [Pseudonocardia saturnea]